MPYKGVYLEGNSWLARIFADGKQHRIGRYATEEEAARAYDREAITLHGDHATLNFGEDMKEHKKAFAGNFVPVPKDWQQIKHHPLACIVEFGAGVDFDQMAAHMRENGYDEGQPIVLYRDGGVWKILDGRHKQAAAVAAGVVPSFREFTGADPKAYVEMKAHRQHLNESQRALFFVKLGKLLKTDGDDLANLQGGKPKQQSQAKIAEASNTSPRTVADAVKVDAKGTAALNQAVADGAVTVSDAAKIADQPDDVQDQAVDAKRGGKTKTARASAAKNPSSNGKHKNGAVDFDDRKVEELVAKLYKLLNERAQALSQQKAASWDDVRDKMELLNASWKRWQLKREKK